jgi:hypothetical protein
MAAEPKAVIDVSKKINEHLVVLPALTSALIDRSAEGIRHGTPADR